MGPDEWNYPMVQIVDGDGNRTKYYDEYLEFMKRWGSDEQIVIARGKGPGCCDSCCCCCPNTGCCSSHGSPLSRTRAGRQRGAAFFYYLLRQCTERRRLYRYIALRAQCRLALPCVQARVEHLKRY